MATPEIRVISESFVKPSPEGPPQLKQHQLSSYDKITLGLYVPLALFYPSHGQGHSSEVAQMLKNSLSRTLSSYRHFAGRLIHNSHVDCNDMGVRFLEVNVSSSMDEVLKLLNTGTMDDLVFPSGVPWRVPEGDSMVVAQLTYFECGGIAVSVSMSHKIGDVSSLGTFVNDWAAVARNSSYTPSPQFVGPSISPVDDVPSSAEDDNLSMKSTCRSRRLVFDASKIAELKALAASSEVENPTRVEVVTTFLHKCAVTAVTALSGSFTPAILLQAVNMRQIISPPLPKTSIGNAASCYGIVEIHENQMKLPFLVGQLRRSKIKLYQKNGKQTKDHSTTDTARDQLQELSDGDRFNCFVCTSWSRFPMYDVDFGWKKPSRVFVPHSPVKNTIVLVDTPDQVGIEAVITLEEVLMAVFERDEELLAFASMV